MNDMTLLQQRLIAIVNKIPKGKVASYGQVAVWMGMPRGARAVGWLLRGMEEVTPHPWWRVVNNEGKITIKGNKWHSGNEQRQRLEAEGVVIGDDFTFEIEKYRFRP